MPHPLRRRNGNIVLLMSVGRSVGRSRALIFHMLIGIGKDKKPIDVGFTWSKVKVTRVTFVNKLSSAQYLNIN